MDKLKKKDEHELVSVQTDILAYVDKAELEELNYDDLVNLGRGVNEVKTYSSWLLGKLGNSVANKFGDAKRYAADIGQNYTVLWNYVGAYRKYTKDDPTFSPDKYFGQVPWGMLYVVSQQEQPVKLLNELVDKGVKTMEGAVHEIKVQKGLEIPPKKPKIVFIWNPEETKWEIDISEEDFHLISWKSIKTKLMGYLETVA